MTVLTLEPLPSRSMVPVHNLLCVVFTTPDAPRLKRELSVRFVTNHMVARRWSVRQLAGVFRFGWLHGSLQRRRSDNDRSSTRTLRHGFSRRQSPVSPAHIGGIRATNDHARNADHRRPRIRIA